MEVGSRSLCLRPGYAALPQPHLCRYNIEAVRTENSLRDQSWVPPLGSCIYWGDQATETIGRVNVNGTHETNNFIPNSGQVAGIFIGAGSSGSSGNGNSSSGTGSGSSGGGGSEGGSSSIASAHVVTLTKKNLDGLTVITADAPGVVDWTVPKDAHRLNVVAAGARGGNGVSYGGNGMHWTDNGGTAGQLGVDIRVTPGEKLQLVVGKNGADGDGQGGVAVGGFPDGGAGWGGGGGRATSDLAENATGLIRFSAGGSVGVGGSSQDMDTAAGT